MGWATGCVPQFSMPHTTPPPLRISLQIRLEVAAAAAVRVIAIREYTGIRRAG